jgi:alpha-L-fucosidase
MMLERSRCIFAILLVSALLLFQDAAAQYSIPARMQWWYEARFGMFIHFGSYSYLGHGEWAFFNENWTKGNYQTQVSAKFNPSEFNAGTIARLAKKAGMKYLVITAKHHEGFGMWKTAVQSFKDTSGSKLYDLPDFTPFGTRDVLKELKDSCEAQGIKFCLYYSILDWSHTSQTVNHSSYYSNMASDSARIAYINDMKSQLAELISTYHPAVMWFDGDWTRNSGAPTLTSWWTKSDGIALYNYVLGLNSTLIVNERVCRGFSLGDFDCPEQQVPTAPLTRQWETCQTMNGSWGYNASDLNFKTSKTLIQQLVTVVSRDGNYLLNIGPKGDGTVPDQSISILNSLGDWMGIFGKSIYGAIRSPYTIEPHWGVYTRTNGQLYVQVFSWPANRLLRIPSLTSPIDRAYLMNDTTTMLQYKDSSGCVSISLPTSAPNVNNSVIVLEVAGLPTASSQYKKVTGIAVKNLRGLNSILTGDTLQFSAAITPSDAAIKSASWNVSDTTVASISVDGLLTGKISGAVTVTATANDGTDVQGTFQISVTNRAGVDHSSRPVPNTPELKQNYPNPFNPQTTIEYSIPHRAFVTIRIFDSLGRNVGTLASENAGAGSHSVLFDAGNLASGIYLYRLTVVGSDGHEFASTRKMTITK